MYNFLKTQETKSNKSDLLTNKNNLFKYHNFITDFLTFRCLNFCNLNIFIFIYFFNFEIYLYLLNFRIEICNYFNIEN